jgi:N4-(beta-N-acetylglucosaminyl)-L-asparaginase
MSVSRRDFLERSALLAALGFTPRSISYDEWLAERERRRAAARRSGRARPVVIASANGHRTDGRPSGVKIAYDMITNGQDTLDAILAGVNTVELDPQDTSVGLGGLPNEEGVIQLDSSCMHGPTKRAGAVGCLEDIATPSLVARAVMDYTNHVFLAGRDAKRFALAMGFKEQDLMTPETREQFQRWKANRAQRGDGWISDKAREDWLRWSAAQRTGRDPEDDLSSREGLESAWTHGTINMDAVNAAGDLSSVTTTSGLAWKVPGRVGDSPIIGAGQYCDNTVGAAGSTGRGESNIKVCGAFLAVEFMRQGLSPEAALIKVMERVIAMTEPRLLDARGRPRFDLTFYALAKDGRYSGASAYSGARFAVCDERGPRLEQCAYLFPSAERPR